jgi:hypothetical protein
MSFYSFGFTTFLKALSKSFGSSEASTSRAISTKRLCRSASLSFGKGFVLGFVFAAMPNNVSSSNGNSSWRASVSRRFPRHTRGRLGRLFWPSATSCFVGKTLTACSLNHNRGAKLHAVAVAKIELAEIPLQVGF